VTAVAQEPILDRLAALVKADGGLLAEAVGVAASSSASHGEQVAHAPRAVGHGADLPLVVEAVREGYLLHHGAARVIDGSDRDLALLAGDRLYASGLELLAGAGDLASVRALADVIALSAGAHAAGDPVLADAVWDAGCAEIGWGPSEALDTAKLAAQSGEQGAADALLNAAHEVRQAGSGAH
jgi:hypothetical protein